MKVGEIFQFGFYQTWTEIGQCQAYSKIDIETQIPCLATLKLNASQIK